ncbi:PE family protein, partial [Mycobacterium basiliense]
MSFVSVSPQLVESAVSELTALGSALGAANAAAMGPTVQIVAAGADEVSAAIAALFGAQAQEYQAISAQVAVFHGRFMEALAGAGSSYAAAEAFNAAAQSVEHDVLAVINAPTLALWGRGLIGDGADGGPGQNGGAGGLLYGNGGNGGASSTRGVAGGSGGDA